MLQTKPIYKVRKISDLKDMLNQSSQIFNSHKAFMVKASNVEGYNSISYAKFKEDVDSLGTALIKLGLKNKHIAIIAENRYEWAVSYFSVVNGTGVVVPIDKALPDNEIASILERSEASAVIFSGKFYNLMKSISVKNNNLKIFIGMDIIEDDDNFLSFLNFQAKGKLLLQNGDKSFIDAPIDNQKMSVLLFTSGTTELSKAVMLSHKNICSDIMDVCSLFKVRNDDVFLSFLPLHHTYECTCGFLGAIYNGAAIAYCEGLKHIVKNLKEFKATIMCSVPLLYENMYKKIWDQASKKPGAVIKMKIALKLSNFLRRIFRINLSRKIFKQIHDTLGGHIRVFLSGAAAINPKVAKGFRDFGIHFIQGYGLTECSPLVTANGDIYFKDNAGGVPLPNVEVKIEAPANSRIGEIITKGPNVMLGYYKNEEATSKVLKDGWFYTGDLGYVDKDGFIHIVGRKKNVIVLKNGKNIFPEELETLLNRSPYIKESMVWEKSVPNNKDTIICATIVIDKESIEEKIPDKPLNLEQIHALITQELKLINKKLPLYKYIREFTIREKELIKTTTQKIKRYMEKVK